MCCFLGGRGEGAQYALLRLIKSHSMETPGTKDGVGFVQTYIYTGPIWGWGCHQMPRQCRGHGAVGEARSIRWQSQGASGLGISAHPSPASAQHCYGLCIQAHPFSAQRDRSLEEWVNPWDGKILLIKQSTLPNYMESLFQMLCMFPFNPHNNPMRQAMC